MSAGGCIPKHHLAGLAKLGASVNVIYSESQQLPNVKIHIYVIPNTPNFPVSSPPKIFGFSQGKRLFSRSIHVIQINSDLSHYVLLQ
jgi:hypothetical protein